MKQERGLPKLAKPQFLDEQAYVHIKQAILSCVLTPGEFLTEAQLAQDLGISKTPIRTAMARLQDENFIITIPYKGHYVADISTEDTLEIYQLRQILECHLVRETAQQFTPPELDQIEVDIQAAEEAYEQEDYLSYVAHNRKFHHAFPLKYGNQRILHVLTNLDDHIRRILLYKLQIQSADP